MIESRFHDTNKMLHIVAVELQQSNQNLKTNIHGVFKKTVTIESLLLYMHLKALSSRFLLADYFRF